jgi:hypothetical protein
MVTITGGDFRLLADESARPGAVFASRALHSA